MRPKLRNPITKQTLREEMTVLANTADIGSFDVKFPASLDAEHDENPRRYAQCAVEIPLFEFAHAILELPWPQRLGLYAHEIGHVVAWRTVGEHSEDDADRYAYEALGVRIEYDMRWPGKGLQRAATEEVTMVMNPRKKKPRASAERAVKAMQLYLGSILYARPRDEQKLYAKARKAVDKAAADHGMTELSAWEQVEAEARKRGKIRPMPGKDI